MLARPKIVSAASARNYFENDTYFINNEFEQGSFYGGLNSYFLFLLFRRRDLELGL